ncbi:MAG: hypothetical protein OQJ93_06860 [Ignavibacteriaceae bacterium]|jgi:hypothetical protein|nr:hypothetical protein [Ignavibacteriaceae bacterium]MCW8812885.1 hypothetical protein [Chlorobium sp.]MCW8816664.1 hypothetical protein [Ignavibacteriaceae bacterium]MCW8996790.1 hypothetical protein [Psychromonas sp.]MCW9097091.1 hypothetical protein [Ignavibacteriaceae bacterium]
MKKCFVFFLLLLVTNSCQWLTDSSDKSALEKHFDIPDDAEMIAYDGFPTMVGFGQREGLNISAKYLLSNEDMNEWIKNMQTKGLKKLPIDPECKSKLWFKDKLIPTETENGYYYCKTAGDDVLNATETRSCDEVDNLNDIIFAILDTEKKELSVIVTSGY